MAASQSGSLDTFPRLLLNHALVRGDRPATREKDLGIWQTWTWSEVAERSARHGLRPGELGFKRGDNLAIIGDNRPRLYMMMSAAQMLGGVPVPMYQDAVANEMLFVLQDAGIRFVIVEDQEQVDKLLEIKDQCPTCNTSSTTIRAACAITTSPSSRWPGLMIAGARSTTSNHPDFIDAEVAAGQSDDVSVMLYTSGTTGKPKGVCQTHEPSSPRRRAASGFDKLTSRRHSFLPADGLGRRPPVLLRPGAGGGLHHQLPGIRRYGDDRSARDRPDLLLRAAAGVREAC
jgi:long-chain acyl-CoA synthetase